MNSETLRALQAPLKEKYKGDPGAARAVLRAEATLGAPLTCKVVGKQSTTVYGLHPYAGGSPSLACSGDTLLEALVACVGVTLSAVATAIGIEIRTCSIRAEGDLDFRGTLGVAKDVSVGFQKIRVAISIDSPAAVDEIERLLRLIERYCVVSQTLKNGTEVTFNYEPLDSMPPTSGTD